MGENTVILKFDFLIENNGIYRIGKKTGNARLASFGALINSKELLVVYTSRNLTYTTRQGSRVGYLAQTGLAAKWAVSFCWLPPVLTSNCDGDLKKAFNECLGVSNAFPTTA